MLSKSDPSILLILVECTGLRAPILLPMRSCENPRMALERYRNFLFKEEAFVELLNGLSPSQLDLSSFQLLQLEDLKHQVVLIANTPRDYLPERQRLDDFRHHFLRQGAKSVLLPLAPTIGLTETETKAFVELIAKECRLLVAMGGDDVCPSLYNQENCWSQNTHRHRDEVEISIIKAFLDAKKGFFLGVCRGHQLTSVAYGYELIQDIPKVLGSSIVHATNEHRIQVFPTTHSHMKKVSSLCDVETPSVSTLHHQSVFFKPGGELELAAITDDGVVEALEFKSGQGLLVQFHPETMTGPYADAFFRYVVQCSQARSS